VAKIVSLNCILALTAAFFLPKGYLAQHFLFLLLWVLMLPVGFGWSAGDLVKAIEILTVVGKVFRDAGGAVTKFQEEAGFLDSIISTLSYIQAYVEENPGDKYAEEIGRHVSRLSGPIESIHKSHRRYVKSLGQGSRMPKLRRAPAAVRYTLRDFASDIIKKQSAIMQPLGALGALLTLQSL